VVTLAHQRVDGAAREVFLDWGSRLTHLSAHPHIAAVAAVGLTEKACPYVAVQATRTTLADDLRETGPLPAGQVRALGVALADTLATIHTAGLIHGALQPATILSGPGRKLMIAGFDATAPVLAHSLPATAYSAPEHLEPAKAGTLYASPSADVHNLATLLYAALGGTLPWLASQGQDVTDPLLRAAPVPDIPGVSIALTDVLGMAMNSDPKRRPSAADLRDRLASVDISRPLAAGARPKVACVDLVPRSGPRPTPLPGGADVALPSKQKRKRRMRLTRSFKVAMATASTFLVAAAAGLATFAVTHADPAPPCPSDAAIASAVKDRYGQVSITAKRCTESSYVGVVAQVPAHKRDSADTVTKRIALHKEDGAWKVLPDCDKSLPHGIRDYLDCD
jgi:serine/threonine protein kinase